MSQDGVESNYPETKFQTILSYFYFTSHFEKLTVKKSIAELLTVTSNQMIKYQLPHTRFDQINDHKNDIYL